MSELTSLSLAEARDGLKKKSFSATELASAHQTAIEKARALNAFVLEQPERAAEMAKHRGAKRAILLPVSAPFHCALMQPAQDRLAADLFALELHNPEVPVMCNVGAALVCTGDASRDALIRQVTGAVHWVKSMRALIALGVENFVEVGPGKVLCGLMRQIDRSRSSVNVEDEASLQKTLAHVLHAVATKPD